MEPLYADVILPVAQPAYTFSVPESLAGQVAAGSAVAVRLGPRKHYTGVVRRLHATPPPGVRLRPIEGVLYDRPLADEVQMAFWEWIAEYYLCTPGEVLAMALPAAIKPSGMEEGALAGHAYRPRQRAVVRLAPAYRSPEALGSLRTRWTRAPRRTEVLDRLVHLLEEAGGLDGTVGREQLAASSALLGALVREGAVELLQEERPEATEEGGVPGHPLTEAQQGALVRIRALWDDHEGVLLQGVAGSGKTELYLRLIADTVAEGRDALLLVPEIALSGALLDRLRERFGERVVAYHSRRPMAARASLYLAQTRPQGGRIIVGTRSALLLPLRRLGLVVIDEEHDPSYKQSEPAPRFHARDAALVLARMRGARVVMGSATPSIESWVNAARGKFGRVVLQERYGAAPAPRIVISDTLRAVRRGERRAHFNLELREALEQTLAERGQAVLIQDRRGYAPFVACDGCGWVPRCPHCEVSLTLHRSGTLRCHYCGYATPLVAQCPECGSKELRPEGFGTEKVVDELQRLYPEAVFERLDRDAATTDLACRRILERFARGQTDVLIGTRMLTKGFDFAGVRMVGLLNADNLLNQPDFRASERAFQTMMQAAGRAGRRTEQGIVVIQSAQPEHPVLRHLVAGDYEGMVLAELAERRAFFYPPYARLIVIELRSRDAGALEQAQRTLGERLGALFGSRLLGPTPPLIERIRDQHRVQFLLRIEMQRSAGRAKALLHKEIEALRRTPEGRKVSVIGHVDPQ